MPGRFVDEIYTEDDEEAELLANEESLRSARMLGCLLRGTMIFLLLAILAVLIAWPR